MMRGDLRRETSALADEAGIETVEEDLFSLNAIAPDLLEHVPALFEETVRGSLSYMLGARESKKLLDWFRADELRNRDGVFSRLASVYGERASPLQIMIDRAFGIRVHHLLQQLI
jgi:hypothetical protein